MSKFKAGDRVVVVEQDTVFKLRHGEIQEFVEGPDFPVKVLLDDATVTCFGYEELELEEVYDALSAKPAEQSSSPKTDVITTIFNMGDLLASKVDTSGDVVNHPSHYTSHPSGVECIEITKHMGFLDGNAMKYLWRYSLKNGVEDLYKCRQYLDWLIESEESKRADS